MTCYLNQSQTFDEMVRSVTDRFHRHYGKPASLVSVAPGRVNVIGEHVDYNGGWVLPAAIERYLMMAVHPRKDGEVHLASANGEAPVCFSVDDMNPDQNRDWGRYVRGVLAGLKSRGIAINGFDAMVESSIPIGGGLSSSAALEGATGLVALSLAGTDLDRFELAKICQEAEHTYAGVPCGIMDQAAVLNCREGHLLRLDCESETFEHAAFDAPGWELMIINSGVAHELASGEYGARRKACHDAAEILGVSSLRHIPMSELEAALASPQLSDEMIRCVRHNVTENDRTAAAVVALGNGDLERAGELLNGSHASLRDDFRVSCVELDFIVATAQPLDGVAGCRMTGGGFGGSCVALVKAEQAETVAATVGKAYRDQYGFVPAMFLTKPAAGGRVVSLQH